MDYLIIKALHLFFVIAWFAGLFYLPRIFVNLAMAGDMVELARLKLMAGRAQYQKGSGTAEELVWDTLDSFKLDYGT